MNSKQKLFILVFLAVVFVTMSGMFYNIKTVGINEKIKTIRSEIRRLKKDNDAMKVYVLSQTRYEILEKIAIEELKMIPESQATVILKGIPNEDQ